MTRAESIAYLGSEQLFTEYQRAGWLKPFQKRNRLTLYDRHDLDFCIDRHKVVEPVPLPK